MLLLHKLALAPVTLFNLFEQTIFHIVNSKLSRGEGRRRQDTTLTRAAVIRLALAEQNVARHAPVRTPRVLHLPELIA